MSIRIYTFSSRRPDLSPGQYKEYYEKTHAPLILSLLGDAAPLSYIRNYISRSNDATQNYPAQLLMGQGQELDFDCVCESVFRDQVHLERCLAELNRPDKREQREADEANFLDMSKLKVVTVETHGNYADGA
ncbi:EthD domain-containing protein [Xylariomycetidae sp. FL2044]|nr:EthD domain-containing protein [Xylariomycetidae sp. FL2044]